MSLWALFWLTLLGLTGLSFLLMLIIVGRGAVTELKQTLNELRDFTEPAE